MNFIEHIWIGKKSTETGFGAKEDRPPMILGTRIVLRVGIAKDPSAESDELFMFLSFGRLF